MCDKIVDSLTRNCASYPGTPAHANQDRPSIPTVSTAIPPTRYRPQVCERPAKRRPLCESDFVTHCTGIDAAVVVDVVVAVAVGAAVAAAAAVVVAAAVSLGKMTARQREDIDISSD